MRLRSWEEEGLDQRRAAVFVAFAGATFFALVLAVGEELRAGSAALLLAAMAGAAAAYLVSTAPKRAVGRAAFGQTVEAPSFAASANVYLLSTSSRSKTLLMLRAEEPRLGSFLRDVGRRVLLGYDAPSAVRAAGPGEHVFSESAKTVVDSVVGVDRSRVEEGGDELDGLLSSSGLEEETKLPLFIAVSFFLPIMMMLFCAVTRHTGAASIGGLVVLELVVLDLALAVSGPSAGWEARGA